MSPILDSIGSVKGFGWGKILLSTAFESIATSIVGSGGSSYVEFTSIPQTYTHLQIRGIGKFNGSGNIAIDAAMQFNGDTGNNYSRHHIEGGSGTVVTSQGANQSSIPVAVFSDNAYGSNFFQSFVCDILDYKNTNKYTSIKSISGYDVNNLTYNGVKIYSGNWRNTNAVTSIKLFAGVNIAEYSHIALYGIKGAA